MSHILIVGAGPAGLAATLRLAERGQRVTLAAAKPPMYNRCAGLPGIDLPEEDAQALRALGAQNLSGHEVMQALSRRLLRYESDGHVNFLPYHRLLQLAVASDGRCAGGVLFNEFTDTLNGVAADAVLLATGGMHTLFSENRFGCDGAAAALAFQAGAALRNPDQLPGGGRYPICTGGLITSWDGETTLPGLYAAGECADGTAQAFPFAQAMTTGTAAADALSESLPEADKLESECAVSSATTRVQQLLDAFRQTRGARAPAAVEQRIRDTVQRVLAGERTAKMLQRGLLDIKVMRQQAARGGYDLGEGLYLALRLPPLLHMLEVMLTTAAFRLLRQDGELTAVQKDDKIEVTARRSAAVDAAAQDFGVNLAGAASGESRPAAGTAAGEAPPAEPSLKDDLWRANAPARPAKTEKPAPPAVPPEPPENAAVAEPAEQPQTVGLRPELAEQLAATPATEQTIIFSTHAHAAPHNRAPVMNSPQKPAAPQTAERAKPLPEAKPAAARKPLSNPETQRVPIPPQDPRKPIASVSQLNAELTSIMATPMLDADMKRMSAVRSAPEPASAAAPIPSPVKPRVRPAAPQPPAPVSQPVQAAKPTLPAAENASASAAETIPAEKPPVSTAAEPAPAQNPPISAAAEAAPAQKPPVSTATEPVPTEKPSVPVAAEPLSTQKPPISASAPAPAKQPPVPAEPQNPARRGRNTLFTPDPEDMLALTSKPKPRPEPVPAPKPEPAPRPQPAPQPEARPAPAAKPSRDFTAIPDPEELLKLPSDR